MMIYPVPEIFKAPDFSFYPSDNWPDFEYWFMQTITEDELRSIGRVYLPILFTAYFKRNGYGSSEGVATLQRFIDTIPTGMKYFTIVQYDDGTLVDWKDKDVKVFAMSGKPKGCIPIPLVCQPHPFNFDGRNRDILVSFVGRITDPIREKILKFHHKLPSAYISTTSHSLEEYCRILARSKFVLCPRGYGVSSFRFAEALQYGAEPIVMGNEGDKPFEGRFYSFLVNINESTFDDIREYILLHSNYNNPLMPKPNDIYRLCYTFDGLRRLIINALWDLLW